MHLFSPCDKGVFQGQVGRKDKRRNGRTERQRQRRRRRQRQRQRQRWREKPSQATNWLIPPTHPQTQGCTQRSVHDWSIVKRGSQRRWNWAGPDMARLVVVLLELLLLLCSSWTTCLSYVYSVFWMLSLPEVNNSLSFIFQSSLLPFLTLISLHSPARTHRILSDCTRRNSRHQGDTKRLQRLTKRPTPAYINWPTLARKTNCKATSSFDAIASPPFQLNRSTASTLPSSVLRKTSKKHLDLQASKSKAMLPRPEQFSTSQR